ncbi:MAG: PDZ domain-containing protein [Rubrivivax sp.]
MRIVRVTDDSPADVAGLEPGDRIMRIDGAAVAGLAQALSRAVGRRRARRAVTLEICARGGRRPSSCRRSTARRRFSAPKALSPARVSGARVAEAPPRGQPRRSPSSTVG